MTSLVKTRKYYRVTSEIYRGGNRVMISNYEIFPQAMSVKLEDIFDELPAIPEFVAGIAARRNGSWPYRRRIRNSR